jgi:hypothetical protein
MDLGQVFTKQLIIVDCLYLTDTRHTIQSSQSLTYWMQCVRADPLWLEQCLACCHAANRQLSGASAIHPLLRILEQAFTVSVDKQSPEAKLYKLVVNDASIHASH